MKYEILVLSIIVNYLEVNNTMRETERGGGENSSFNNRVSMNNSQFHKYLPQTINSVKRRTTKLYFRLIVCGKYL